jgi:putative transposase
MAYRQILYHLVFVTKHRKPTLTEAHDKELYDYIWGIIKNKKCKLFRINGVEDHIHILSDLHPSIALSDYVKDIKVATSIWLKEHGGFAEFEAWAEGYGAFTHSIKERQRVIDYIKKQKEHHKTVSFTEEYISLLQEHEIDFDEKYILGH